MYHCRPNAPASRRGAAHVLIAIMLIAATAIAGLTVDLAYMQVLRIEQKIATDAAAQAAVEALMRTESVSDAESAAIDIANDHVVGSQQFAISSDDIEFGRSTPNADGSYDFSLNEEPINSARVYGRVGGPSIASIPMMFSSMGHSDYSREVNSISTFIINEVCLCIDRSGSMKFDDSGVSWSYPPNNPLVNSSDFWDNYYGAPHPDNSRWAMLMAGINVFMTEAEASESPPRTSLVTWSSDSMTDVTLPNSSTFSWSANRAAVEGALFSRSTATGSGNDSVFGATQLAMGLQEAIDNVTVADSHDFASRTIVLFTDGEYQGNDPLPIAQAANAQGITIHCITFITGSAYNEMETLAQATGGTAYMAHNETELVDAFRDIARSLNIVLTK